VNTFDKHILKSHFSDIGKIEIEWRVSGKFIPSRWGYSGADPDEFPEIEIENIYSADDSSCIIAESELDPKWIEKEKEKLLEEVLEEERYKEEEYEF
jgi:hypothetical protein